MMGHPLDAYQVLRRVYGVSTRTETRHIAIPANATSTWFRLLPVNARRVSLTIQNLDEDDMLISIGYTPDVGSDNVPALYIAGSGQYYTNLWEDFAICTQAVYVQQSATGQNASVLESIISPELTQGGRILD